MKAMMRMMLMEMEMGMAVKRMLILVLVKSMVMRREKNKWPVHHHHHPGLDVLLSPRTMSRTTTIRMRRENLRRKQEELYHRDAHVLHSQTSTTTRNLFTKKSLWQRKVNLRRREEVMRIHMNNDI